MYCNNCEESSHKNKGCANNSQCCRCQGDCQVNIPKEILQQAVIMSADVIEHIVDPYYCYLPLMSYLMDYAHALVLSTPDRELRGKFLLTMNSGVSSY